MKNKYIVVYMHSNKIGNIEIEIKKGIRSVEDFRKLAEYLEKRFKATDVVITNIMRLPL